jgi:nuclear transport factor 2 (NTF2) superfamily protein
LFTVYSSQRLCSVTLLAFAPDLIEKPNPLFGLVYEILHVMSRLPLS